MFQVWFKNRRAKDRKQNKETGKNATVSEDSDVELSEEERERKRPKKEKPDDEKTASPSEKSS